MGPCLNLQGWPCSRTDPATQVGIGLEFTAPYPAPQLPPETIRKPGPQSCSLSIFSSLGCKGGLERLSWSMLVSLELRMVFLATSSVMSSLNMSSFESSSLMLLKKPLESQSCILLGAEKTGQAWLCIPERWGFPMPWWVPSQASP